MEIDVATQVVREYGAVLLEGQIARPASLLPFTKSIIKYGIMVYLESAIYQKLLTDEQKTAMIDAYGMLDHFIEDAKAEKLNELHKLVKEGKIDLNSEKNLQARSFYEKFMKIYNSTKNRQEIIEFMGSFNFDAMEEDEEYEEEFEEEYEDDDELTESEGRLLP